MKYECMNGSPGLVVTGDNSCLKGCGFESWCRTLDGHLDIFTLICCKNYIVCLKTPKLKEIEAGDGPFFKKSNMNGEKFFRVLPYQWMGLLPIFFGGGGILTLKKGTG